MSKLSSEECEILNVFEKGKSRRSKNTAKTQKKHQEYVEAIFRKDARINIRHPLKDPRGLQIRHWLNVIVRRIFTLLMLCLFSVTAEANIKNRVQLDVPVVKQGKSLCGPATIEMLFKYWGVNGYSQYDIAESLLVQFSNSKRYRNSGIINTNPIDWSKYPGTGTINMREFLKRFGKTKNIMLEHEPVSRNEKINKRNKMFQAVKQYLSDGIPVIVHQYWKLPKSRGHYRIVTGYDEYEKVVYLNDANPGKRLTQTYEEFLKLWNFNQRWLHYNAIAFNLDRESLDIKL
ncbi:MAG: C39 family peptidase [Candidatus Thiodiazotropha sp.]|nr:MAG: hypothetical protein DBP03_08625 [gamma proteobacterium symbiont of Ctena orbiculata]